MSAPRHAIFISYRRKESSYAVDQLDQRLRQAFGEHVVFRDVNSIRKGYSFPDDIKRALAEATIGIVVIGPWWLETDGASPPKRRIDEPDDWVRMEVEALLQRQGSSGEPIPVIPVLIGGATTPRAADLPDSLKPLAVRDGQHLRPEPDFGDSIRQLIDHIGTHLGVTPLPLVPGKHPAPAQPPRVSATRLNVTGKNFVGREQELLLLDEAWGRSGDDKINIVSLIGQGGEGKTALVIEWYSRRARRGWPEVKRVFDWSFYSQGTSAQSSASADEFFNAAFTWFGHTGEVPKDAWTKGAKLAELVAAERTLLVLDGLEPLQQPPGDYGGEFKDPAMKSLLRGLALHNPGLCLLTSRTDITDLSSYEHGKGACLRHPLHSLDPAAARALLRELGVLGPDKELDEAINWFHRHAYDLNLLGNYLAKCTADHDIRGWRERFPILSEDEKIHPVPDAQGKRTGHGRRMLRAYERWLNPSEPQVWWKRWWAKWVGLRKARSSPAVEVLRLLGLFDRPVRSDLLDELRDAPLITRLTAALVPLPDAEWLRILNHLEQLALISRVPLSLPAEIGSVMEENDPPADVPDELIEMVLQSKETPAEMKKLSRTELKRLLAQYMADEKKGEKAKRPRRPVSYTLDCHPLLREHFAVELRERYPDARREGHRRLYEYLCATTPDKPDATLEDLQPLYQAVAHGCHAGLQQEACASIYRDRILRGDEAYAVHKLGALGADLGAIACFFETPWNRVSSALTEGNQGWLLNEAAFRLRALGQLTAALEPLRAGLEMGVKQQYWTSAAVRAGNLSELELTLGEVGGAVRDAEQSVTYADRGGDTMWKYTSRATHADALHQAGRRAEAESRFREAEQMQAEWQPDYPLLYSLRGFQYCDLLLAEVERAGWQRSQKLEVRNQKSELEKTCRAVSERAAKTLKWVTGKLGLINEALHHLSLGRAAFYRAIIYRAKLPVSRSLTATSQRVQTTKELATALRELDSAVDGLRSAGQQFMLPHGLLSRAWLRFVEGKRTGSDSAQSDLDEAWETAERGSMKLHMADVLLYRARLFGARNSERGVRSESEETYPWVSAADDLAAAETLINACGYHRRDGELADAKAALL